MVAGLVIQTIQMMRMSKCDHSTWVRINIHEEQCNNCSVIATVEGKAHLEKLKVKFNK